MLTIVILTNRCPNEGCREEFRLGDLEIHLSTCAHAEEKVVFKLPVGGGKRVLNFSKLFLLIRYFICIDIRVTIGTNMILIMIFMMMLMMMMML